MTDTKMIGWKATAKDLEIVDAIGEKTDETTRAAVLRKAVRSYARSLNIEVPA